MEVAISKMRLYNGPKTKAFFDLLYGKLIISGFKIVNGNQGRFISWPREKGKNEQWYNTVMCNDPFLAKEIENLAYTEYKKITEGGR